MYFTRFPKGQYIIPGTKEYKLVSDLWRRVKIRDKIKNEASLYSEYFVADGERPETIAERHFGSPELHWIILISNDVTDSGKLLGKVILIDDIEKDFSFELKDFESNYEITYKVEVVE